MEFISEPITPARGEFDTGLMAAGLAACPKAFTWRNHLYQVVECLEHYKESAAEGHTSGGERYLRRQVFRLQLDSGDIAQIYVQRQAKRGSRQRWFIYTIERANPS